MWMKMDELAKWVEIRPQDFATGFLECWKVFSEKMVNTNKIINKK